MQRRKRLELIAIPFQFAAAHALGYGVATRLVAAGAMQMALILAGNTIGITAIGLATERLLATPKTPSGRRVLATAVACAIGTLLVSLLSSHRYEALVIPILLGVIAFHIPANRAA